MIYYLATWLVPYMTELNVFTYHTVRAGGAAVTGFLVCLIIGPGIIHRLREFKIGQYIKKDHVADLHKLHQGKSGTPTMGGLIMLFSTAVTLLLWSTLNNRLLWVALLVLLTMGAVGFLDDYIKLKRKHNDGLSARAKFMGQILTGLVLGIYLLWFPITVNPSYIQERDLENWRGLLETLADGNTPEAAYIWSLIPEAQQADLARIESNGGGAYEYPRMLAGLRAVLDRRDLYRDDFWPAVALNEEGQRLLTKGVANLDDRELVRFNRLLLEVSFPAHVAKTEPNLHTKVGVPGFKNLFIPLGIAYILFVIFIITAVSNAVNLTDGLDGLAAGTAMISISTYTAIAYVVSRADWSHYLYLTYVPEASELFVFGAALLGTGLGFLWFNSHPAEVFMGDTGSLSLGGAIAVMAILTKQELLLPLVCALFMFEAGSVIIQVFCNKAFGKRPFRMTPIHHHFELLGWPETKVTMRFWIIALVFALMSLGTLKLR